MKHSRVPYSITLLASAVALVLAACHKTPAPNAAAVAPEVSTSGAAAADGGDAADGAAEFVSTTSPPPLPDYDQPPIPQDGDVWTPGYWAWDDGGGDYYWTPGTWVQPPAVGLLWTPGYWIFVNARFVFHRGHWGRRVGFYGGIDYGHGYGGEGYQGGRWQGDSFYYNTAANDIADASMSNVYRQAVIERGAPGQASFNGGSGGVSARASPAELAAAQDPRVPPTLLQEQQSRLAQSNPGLRASVNHGAPILAAASHPAVLAGPDAVTAARATGANGARGFTGGPGSVAHPAAQAERPAATAVFAQQASGAVPRAPAASHPPPTFQPRAAARPAAPALRPAAAVQLDRDKSHP